MTKTLGFLIERDGRTLFLRELVEWAVEDSEYKVTALVAKENVEDLVLEVPKEPSITQTDDTQERLQIMEELFEIQESQIALLKGQLEKFIEVVEGIVEITEVISHSPIEARSKLLVISESCKEILKPSE
jgi:hypothetical protein